MSTRTERQLRGERVHVHASHLRRAFGDQLDQVVSNVQLLGPTHVDQLFPIYQFDRDLERTMYRLFLSTAETYALETIGAAELLIDRLQPLAREAARIAAENINQSIRDDLTKALRLVDADDPEAIIRAIKGVYGTLLNAIVRQYAATTVAYMGNFGMHEAAVQAGYRFKVWRTTSRNPRDTHQALDGERVTMDDRFSNGLRWPGDQSGDHRETINCKCLMDFED